MEVEEAESESEESKESIPQISFPLNNLHSFILILNYLNCAGADADFVPYRKS
ncbi:hypothetical protein A2U01_0021085, partial [Trifolium medium]|nr:hypothetical protein [Trifolium medium]